MMPETTEVLPTLRECPPMTTIAIECETRLGVTWDAG